MDAATLQHLLDRWHIELVMMPENTGIPGSFWGDDEAGLIGSRLYARPDTPLHSVLHEAGHFVCMNRRRRAQLHTNAGGTVLEESAVCFLQVLAAGHLPGYDRDQLFADMDAWGYSFRLGSTRAWFEQDAEDARDWLIQHGLTSKDGRITWALREG